MWKISINIHINSNKYIQDKLPYVRLGKIVNYISWLLTFCVCDLTIWREKIVLESVLMYMESISSVFIRATAHIIRGKNRTRYANDPYKQCAWCWGACGGGGGAA